MAVCFKKIHNIDLIFHVHILGIYIHILAGYEVSIIKVVPGDSCTQMMQMQMQTWMQTTTPHDRQSMIA